MIANDTNTTVADRDHAGAAARSDDARQKNESAVSPGGRTLYGLDWVNFFLADVQTGVGPFLAIYLASNGWNEQSVGIALTVGSVAGIITQTPAGALVDRLRAKRTLIAAGVVALAIGALMIAWFPKMPSVMAAQILIGGVSSIFNPAVAAITLGVVGHQLFDRRQGRNQSWNSAGNVTAAVSMGVVAYFLGAKWIFYIVVSFAIPSVLSLLLIDPRQIDYGRARGAKSDVEGGASGFKELLKDRPLVIFLGCAVLFHFANAAMLPLLGEMLARGKGRSSPLFMSACVTVTQVVITLIAWPSGWLAGRWGRKPLLLIAFGALPVRGVLYTLTHNTYALVAIQILDGVGAGIFGVVSILVIADLTRGTGRFNFTQGAIFTAIGLGAALSQAIAGWIVHHHGYNVGFLFLAAVAAAALGSLWMLMPETLNRSNPGRATGSPNVHSETA